MRYLLVFVFTISLAEGTETHCFGNLFNGRYYETETVKEGVNNIRMVAYNPNQTTVYYLYQLLRENVTYSVGYTNLESRATNAIKGIRNPTTIAVDPLTFKVYIGGTDGIFELNENKVPVLFEDRRNIVDICINKVAMYYTDKKRVAYRYRGRDPTTLLQELRGITVEYLLIDAERTIFYIQDKLLFRMNKDRETTLLATPENQTVNFITTDNYQTYFGFSDGVYTYNKYKNVLEKTSDLRDVKSMTFVKRDEPLYAFGDTILRLKPVTRACLDDLAKTLGPPAQ